VKKADFREIRDFSMNFSAFSLIYDNSKVLSAAFVRMFLLATCRTLALNG